MVDANQKLENGLESFMTELEDPLKMLFKPDSYKNEL